MPRQFRIDAEHERSAAVLAFAAPAFHAVDSAARRSEFVAQRDMSLLEVNPLILTEDGDLVCLDAKMNFDSNALVNAFVPACPNLYSVTVTSQARGTQDISNLGYAPGSPRSLSHPRVSSVLEDRAGMLPMNLLDQVYESAERYVGRSHPVQLRRGQGGALEDCFFDFVFQPILDVSGQVNGIAVVAFEVTELVRARRADALGGGHS